MTHPANSQVLIAQQRLQDAIAQERAAANEMRDARWTVNEVSRANLHCQEAATQVATARAALAALTLSATQVTSGVHNAFFPAEIEFFGGVRTGQTLQNAVDAMILGDQSLSNLNQTFDGFIQSRSGASRDRGQMTHMSENFANRGSIFTPFENNNRQLTSQVATRDDVDQPIFFPREYERTDRGSSANQTIFVPNTENHNTYLGGASNFGNGFYTGGPSESAYDFNDSRGPAAYTYQDAPAVSNDANNGTIDNDSNAYNDHNNHASNNDGNNDYGNFSGNAYDNSYNGGSAYDAGGNDGGYYDIGRDFW